MEGKSLKNRCKKLSKKISKYKDVVPLTEEIAALQIGIQNLTKNNISQAGIKRATSRYKIITFIVFILMHNWSNLI
jgi:hypothetical protein